MEQDPEKVSLGKVIKVGLDGLDECQALLNIAAQNRSKGASDALANALTTWIMDESDELSIREQAGKLKQLLSFAVWFGKHDRAEAKKYFEMSMENVPPSRIVPYHLRRAGFYQKILGDNDLALKEIETALSKAKNINFMKFDEENQYTIDGYIRLVDLQLKLGHLQEALEAMKKYQEAAEGYAAKWRSMTAGKLATFRGIFTIGHSLAGGTYAAMREFPKAKVEFEKAWSYMKDVVPENRTDYRALATYHAMYGSYYLGLQGRYDDAAEEVEQGLAYLDRQKPSFIDSIENVLDVESAYLQAAELNLQRNKRYWSIAKDQANKSIDLSKRYQNSVVEGNAHVLLGRIAWESGKADEALREYDKAVKLLKDVKNTDNWRLYYGLGLVYEAQNPAKAIENLKQAVREVETLWEGRFNDTPKQVRFIDDRLVVFEPLIRILVKQGNNEEALTYIERSKSRAFFETNVYAAIQNIAPDPALDSKDKEREKLDTQITEFGENVATLRGKVAEIDKRLGTQNSSSATRGVSPTAKGTKGKKAQTETKVSQKPLSAADRSLLETDRKGYANDLGNIEKLLGEAVKRREALGRKPSNDWNQPLAARQIVSLLASDKGTVLLEYYIGAETVVGAAVTGSGVKAVRELHGSAFNVPAGFSSDAASEGQVEKASSTRGVKVHGTRASAASRSSADLNDAERVKFNVNAFYESIYSKDPDRPVGKFNEPLGALLFRDLVEPFKDVLEGAERVVIVPHGALHYLPFQALVVSRAVSQGVPEQLLDKERVLVAQVGNDAGMSKRGVSVKILPSSEQAELVAVRKAITAIREKTGGGAPLYLIDKYAVTYAPSATVLATTRARSTSKDPAVLAIGAPPDLDVRDLGLVDPSGEPFETFAKLTEAPGELLAVKNIFGERAIAFTDSLATKEAFTSNAPEKDVLLMSTHGMLMRNDPMKSIVFFAPSPDGQDKGRLTVADIEKMKFGPALVVMSACETGLVGGYDSNMNKELQDVKFPKGDDLVGLQRAFIKAGANTVVSSLWPVADASTKLLVVTFFENYRKTGDKAESLRIAEKAVKNSNSFDPETGIPWSQPYFWSPFVLSGNWE